jgi:hypothetical protein
MPWGMAETAEYDKLTKIKFKVCGINRRASFSLAFGFPSAKMASAR